MRTHAGYEKVVNREMVFDLEDYADPPPPRSTFKRIVLPLVAVLLASNICTWYVSEWHTRKGLQTSNTGRSPYANETLRNAAWDTINIDAGMIAVPQSFVAEKGLPDSQRFAWDRSKSVYLLNGHHSLHCARSLYLSLMEYRDGRPQSRNWGHILHCVDHLRQEAICNADDTPRYSTADEIPVTGLDQVRQCRSWEKLEDWARQYNACYRYINQTASYSEVPQIERFVWCPKDSPYVKEVEKVFGHIEWTQDGFTITEPEPEPEA